MIKYHQGGIWYLLNLLKIRGSVFPKSIVIAAPPAGIAFFIKFMIENGTFSHWADKESILKETQAWSGFTFLVGFLIVFRTSQAYSRFWDGCTACHQMRAEWFDACSALISFCRHSKAEKWKIDRFKHTLVRLFSMMHACSLAELEELNLEEGTEVEDIKSFHFNLIDPCGIDAESLRTIKESKTKVELIFEWIQLIIVENIETGVLSIPPPILSRAFQEIANGMVAFHDAMKISYVPFPFPYAQTCDVLLILHWCVVPILTAMWVGSPWWGAVFTFIPVFCLWSLNLIAVEIENPFGIDDNDLDGKHMQQELNSNLLMLLKPSTMRTPKLSKSAAWGETDSGGIEITTDKSFIDIWTKLGGEVARTKRHNGGAFSRACTMVTDNLPSPGLPKRFSITSARPSFCFDDTSSAASLQSTLDAHLEIPSDIRSDSSPGEQESVMQETACRDKLNEPDQFTSLFGPPAGSNGNGHSIVTLDRPEVLGVNGPLEKLPTPEKAPENVPFRPPCISEPNSRTKVAVEENRIRRPASPGDTQPVSADELHTKHIKPRPAPINTGRPVARETNETQRLAQRSDGATQTPDHMRECEPGDTPRTWAGMEFLV